MNDEDEWLNAGCALIQQSHRTLSRWRPCSAASRRFPRNSRHACRVLDPGDPPLYNVRLTPKFIQAQTKDVAFYNKWNAVGLYDRFRAEGVSEEGALEEATKIFPREKSVFHKGRQFIHEFIPKLLKRIRHG